MVNNDLECAYYRKKIVAHDDEYEENELFFWKTRKNALKPFFCNRVKKT